MKNSLEELVFESSPLDILYKEHKKYIESIYHLASTTGRLVARGDWSGDIKFNNMAGRLTYEIMVKDKCAVQWFSCNIKPFTENCGIKAIDSLNVRVPNDGHTIREMLRTLEMFLYHHTNAGMVVGSDSTGGGTYNTISNYGEDYVFSPAKPIWNPNYTWTTDHKIQLFHKNLNKTFQDCAQTDLYLPKGMTYPGIKHGLNGA